MEGNTKSSASPKDDVHLSVPRAQTGTNGGNLNRYLLHLPAKNIKVWNWEPHYFYVAPINRKIIAPLPPNIVLSQPVLTFDL